MTDKTREAADRLVARYPVARSALLPLLHLVQADQGHVSEEGIAFCAERLGLTKAEVGAVATFYTMYKREPVGDWLVSVCTNPMCNIQGAQQIYEQYQEKLGGHHNADAGVTVEHAECLGICDAAPVIQVNYEMYAKHSLAEADALMDKVMAGDPPVSNSSGEKPPTFAEIQWELAGAGDGVDDFQAAGARAQASMDKPPAYKSGQTDLPVTRPGADRMGIGGVIAIERGVPDAANSAPTSAAPEPAPSAAAAAAETTSADAPEADALDAAASGAAPAPEAGESNDGEES